MEENSEVHMNTDVSSTTSDVPDKMQATGIHGNVETTIFVEAIKEEETSPVKSKGAVRMPKLSSEKEQSQIIILDNNVQLIDNNEQSTPTNSKEINTSLTESQQELKTFTKSAATSSKIELVQRTLPLLVQEQKTPTKFEQKIPSKSDQIQKSPNKLLQTQPVNSEQVPKNLDQVQKIIIQSDVVLKKSTQEQKPTTPPKLEQVQKPPVELKLDQFKKYLGLKTPINSDQVKKMLTQSEVVQKTSKKDQMHLTPTKSEQVQKTYILEVHSKLDLVKKVQEPKTASFSYINPSEQQIAQAVIDKITVNELLVKPTEVPETILSETSSKQTIESVKEHESSKETPGRPNPIKSDYNSYKSPIKESLDKQSSNTDFSVKADQIKESSDKVKRVKNNVIKEVVLNSSIASMNTCEKSNDSQENNSDISEKDHNKSISRELKSLIKSAKDSKIINECTQLTSKTRKSRAAADSANTSLNTSGEAEKSHNSRCSSVNSQESSYSEKSEKAPMKRSMRSQNPEFVNKVKLFLNSVTGKNQKGDDADEMNDSKKDTHNESTSPLSKKKKVIEIQLPATAEGASEQTNKHHSDLHCWRCHWVVEHTANEKGHSPLLCTVCPRSFHYKCLSGVERSKITDDQSWICPECLVVLQAETLETRSPAMKKISQGHFGELLKYALDRMMDINGVEPFLHPVDRAAFPDYEKYVVHPMDLSLMKKNVEAGSYGSTEAFLVDAQWILHNSIIFNTCMMQSKVTGVARALVRSCRAEMGEIEACPECYLAAHARRPTWFTDVCSTPHMLLWAKLKGFPYWPAKGMSVNSQGLVDVRFFGAHDRAWVPAKDCFLYCEKDPNNFKAKRQDILESMREAEDHIRSISKKYGQFVYAAYKTPFEPSKLGEQLKMMIPSFDGEVSRIQVKEKSLNSSPSIIKDYKGRSYSVGAAEIAPEKDRFSSTNNTLMEVDEKNVPNKQEFLRKRRRSVHNPMEADEKDIPNNKKELSRKRRKSVNNPMVVGEKNLPNKEEPLRKRRKSANNISMDADDINVRNKEKESFRRRRRSFLEEAVLTVISTSSNEKPKKIEDEKVDDKKIESAKGTSKKTDEKLPINNKTDKTIEIANNKVNATEVPTTPKLSKGGGNEVPINILDKTQVLTSTPIKATLKVKPTRSSTPKEKERKAVTPKQKPDKIEKIEKDKPDDNPKPLRRTSRAKSLNYSQTGKRDKSVEKKNESLNFSQARRRDKSVEKKNDSLNFSQVRKRDKSVDKKSDSLNFSQARKRDKSVEKKNDSLNFSQARKRDKSVEKKNHSLNGSKLKKRDKSVDKKNDKDNLFIITKDKVKNTEIQPKNKENEAEKPVEQANQAIDSSKHVQDRMQIDDNTTLAVIARKKSFSGLPTITSVRSLSTAAQSTSTATKTTTTPKTIEITISAGSTSTVITPTTINSNNVRNMKETVMQKLRNETDNPMVGRVGVRSFARMTSPPAPPQQAEKAKQVETVEVEVKTEPIDFDDSDRQEEKMDLMKSFQLQPVNPVTSAKLRDVRINKVTVTPVTQKAVPKTTEVRIRARKPIPQQRKDGNDSRSELNGKNSMVYIPIQPPTSQAPAQRMTRPITINGNVNTQTVRPQAPTTISNNSTHTTPRVSLPMNTSLSVAVPKPTTTIATNIHNNAICVPAIGQIPNIGQIPSIGHVPNTVHTVPLITSVNGQWTFSLQPMMSVGSDSMSSPPIVNGLSDRNPPFVPITAVNPLSLHQSTQLLPNSNNCGNNNNNGENTPAEMPRLQQRPSLGYPFDNKAPAGPVPTPSCAGPLTAKLNQNAVKLADFFKNMLEDTLEKIDDPSSQATILKMQLEQNKWKHQQEVNELKHTHELLTTEMRVAFEKEKARTITEMRRVAQGELEVAVKAAKTKQWCANCSQEAQFYCCWNTSYCDYSCQRSHWTQHFAACTQQRNSDTNPNEIGNLLDRRLQPGPENLPVSSSQKFP